ncbi:arylesterase [Lutimaribacter sp. EGI FJ00015]|uniref:Arylesterase n=2 Tax=Lutimaribacter degradans TaxID=2945989 RepID=A0ACC5ZU71_9RHOB|nr:arylesterase [Lutimaribacter sp. EGI FJ00013]MCM2561733.1 arylesterase [Lutimaribacter sp. EGI FJ00013]MCO0612554.1 arylesterase [Lutimaribacter sp. EGI FJ00015]MCO0635213.1 arylesterase [Lutimaribacter sp. EGI FJ00014]
MVAPAHAGSHSTTGPTVVALGDSLTQGYGLVEQEGFVPQLRAWLADNGAGDVRVVNAGVSGDTTAGGLSRVAWTLTPDVDAMIVALGGNDMLRGTDPATTRANIDGILAEADKAGVAVLLVGMQAPGNYGPDYKRDFEAIWPDMAEKHDTLLAESFFKGLGEGDDPSAMRAYFQPDGIHPNAEGVKKVVEGLGPHVLDLIARIPDAAG